MAPKPPPRAPKTSPSLDFHRFWVDFGRFFDDFLYHVGYFLSGLPHYFFGYLELSFSNFWPQVQMCWGRPQGSVRSQKSASHRFFGDVHRVISELRSLLLQSNRPPHTNSRGADSSLRKGLRRMLCHSLGRRHHFGWPAPRTTPTAPL